MTIEIIVYCLTIISLIYTITYYLLLKLCEIIYILYCIICYDNVLYTILIDIVLYWYCIVLSQYLKVLYWYCIVDKNAT